MPSSFSPSLRIELIAPGEQAGTWNTTTNTNLGTLIESSIAGAPTISVTTTNQALTIADGAADQSRNAVLQLTTTTGAPFNVYAPPVSKQYTIYNTTAFAATIFNSTIAGNTTAAGTGVTIPAGRTMTVWTNGTNFRVQNDHVIGNVVGNVTGNVTGVVTASAGSTAPNQAFGTNNTTIANTAFVQAALQALHPIGSIYINATNSANPATYFGFGTWVAFGAGRVPVGFNAADPLFDTAEETGGSKDAIVVSHTHTVTASGTTSGQSVGHTHTFSGTTGNQSADHTHSGTTSTAGEHTHGLSFIAPDNQSGGKAAITNFDNAGVAGYTTDSAGSHNHTITTGGVSANHTHDYSGTTSGVSSDHTHTVSVSGSAASTGSSGTNANLPPYITVFMWKRTA